ncbi:Si-specific NAD(P)(+) transhydrogenase [Aliikangiella marina]|uniref:Soluble pyridine nucleotide transhydrogenase n=1 Tax=Aliikangiella marina TaxID=1712262 RepID=A0A545TD93_9GAMM|nr:Si-specific NAD(P)(+) transhydrogenase [Aliikangiella marina]TQV75188.1 Si-specific NAD(P)(+) transhydrogenase [Aliikangiella marina]
MKKESFDLVIIGAGPAGESAAMNAKKHGLSVAVVDLRKNVGGNCTHKGTIPSKTLRHSVHSMMKFNRNPMFRNISDPTLLTFRQVMETAEDVIKKQVNMRARFYSRNDVPIFHGLASFQDNHHILVDGGQDEQTILHADKIIIATGTRPYQPADVDFTHPRVFDSDKILTLNETPKRIIIYGAGVIGCEYASIFNGLGCKVDLVNPGDKLLSYMDAEISDALSYHLRSLGVLIRHNESFLSLEPNDDKVVLNLESGKLLKADIFLWANGRAGNTEKLNLAAAGLTANKRGQLDVDELYRTTTPNIYAVGDVIGPPALASASYDQGRCASSQIVDKAHPLLIEDIPTGIYTIPEISSVGKTESELTAAKIPYEIGKAYFKDTARAKITGEDAGMLKLLFHRETLELLGIHCFGDQAAEILHIGQAIMAQEGKGNTIEYFATHTFNYPTMAEAYRVAALNGLNRL